MNDLPLISLCIATYNQEGCVADAVKSAIAQDYPNLEVVISDDCSKDRTLAVVNDALCGRKAIVLANDKNVGVARNYERAYRAAHGEILVTSGGDDISMPNRVSRIAERWIADGRKATVISHGGMELDKNATPTGRYLHPGELLFPEGWGMAYSRRVIDSFPKIEFGDTYEDLVFSLRGAFLGSLLKIDEPLVKHRVGGFSSLVGQSRRSAERRTSSAVVNGMAQAARDLEFLRGKPDGRSRQEWAAAIKKRMTYNKALLRLVDSESFFTRLMAYVELVWRSKTAIIRFPYVLPRSIGDWMLSAYDSRRKP